LLVTLKELLPEAVKGRYAVPCFNIFGNEEAVAVIAAAEATGRPVIMACNKDMAEHIGVAGFAGMTRSLAAKAKVPVCVHLDHCYEEATILMALEAGFTSVMFDGSQLPLEENIARTAQIVQAARKHGASVEGEIGSVPYTEGRDHIKREFTDPQDAREFAQRSGVDAMAISVGNVHRMVSAESQIDFERIAQIVALTNIPLVIHGTSGIREAHLKRLRTMGVAKFNIGTTMRMTFARSLRASLAANPEQFDRMKLMKPVIDDLTFEARRCIEVLSL
jgi:fructose-bisphosphate aldolase class II